MNNDYLTRMKVPPNYWGANSDTIHTGQKLPVKKYLKNFKTYMKKGWGFLFWGDYGTGKSAAAASLLIEGVMGNGLTGLWVFCDDIPRFIIEKVRFDNDETYQERMQSVDLLVVDELLVHNKRDSFADTSIEMIFRRRTAAKKATVFTSNLSPTQLKEQYPAFANVMLECIVPIKFDEQFRVNKSKSIVEEFSS